MPIKHSRISGKFRVCVEKKYCSQHLICTSNHKMPSLSDAYTIADLPKITLKKTDGIPISVNSSKNGVFHAGISHGSVSTYQLKPTPKAISIYSVSPGTVFTALGSTGEGEETKICFACKDRKASLLKIATPMVKASEGATETSKSVSVDTTEYGTEIGQLEFSSNKDKVYAIFKNASVGCYDAESLELLWTLKAKSSRELVYSTFISKSSEKATFLNGSVKHGDQVPDQVAVVVSKRQVGKKASFEVRIISFDSEGSSVLLSLEVDVKGNDDEIDSSVFDVSEGYLYRFNGYKLEKYALLSGVLVKTVDLPSKYASFNSTSLVSPSIVAVENGDVLVANTNVVLLLDTTYGAMLASIPLEQHVSYKLQAYIEGSQPVALATKTSRSNEISLVAFSLSSSKGSLLEAMNQGIDDGSYSQWKYGFSDLLIKKNTSLRDYTAYLANAILAAQQRNRKILKELEEFKNNHDAKQFEKIVLYFQGTEWSEITDQDISVMLASDDNIPVYDADQDREVDKDLIFGVTKLILEPEESLENKSTAKYAEEEDESDDEDYEDNKTFNVSLNRHFIPEFALNYLLTHPLFPTSQIPNLLEALENYPRLLRQAIVTTQALSCNDLVRYLNAPDDEIFSDTVTRILSEFSLAQITESITSEYLSQDNKRPVSSEDSENKSRLNEIVACIRRLIKFDMGWSLIPALIDAAGLMSWSEELIEEINEAVSEQVEAVETTSKTISLIDEAMRKFDQSANPSMVSNISKRELKKLSRKNAKDNEDSILQFGVGGDQAFGRATSSGLDDIQPSAYTLEKLFIS